VAVGVVQEQAVTVVALQHLVQVRLVSLAIHLRLLVVLVVLEQDRGVVERAEVTVAVVVAQLMAVMVAVDTFIYDGMNLILKLYTQAQVTGLSQLVLQV
jgi:hypothetical protein